MQFMVETISIFLITIINKSLIISFILNKLEDFVVEVENNRLDYLQDDWGIENLISIKQALFWPNDLAQPADNIVLSNKEKNLVNKFKKNCVYELNLSFWESSPWQLPLSFCHNTQTNTVSKWDIPIIKHIGTKTPRSNMIYCKIKNTFDF